MKEKRAKKSNGKGIDRLSYLPDALLLHILSFLPIKTCVNTMSLISHRYRNLWEHLQVLNVDEKDFKNRRTESFSYMSLYVNAFLVRRKSRDIQKFRLSCEFEDLEDFSAMYADMWIRTAIGPYLEELHLSLFSDDADDEDDCFKFPLNLLSSCPKLVSLSLYGDIILQWLLSWEVYLPLLKKLIVDLNHVQVPFLDKLLYCCPILEILEVSICPTSLTTLCMPHSLKRLKFTSKKNIGTCLEIDAPDLKYLSLTGITFEGSTIVNLHKVGEVYLDLVSWPRPGKSLLRALSKIKHLGLGGSTMKWLFDVKFPEFQHLIHLELSLPCFNISFLYRVLRKCPMLQALKIKKHKDPLPPLYEWVPKPKRVPNCLVSHLTFIHFIIFEGNLNELKFIEYVLRKGLVLKTMHISCLSKKKDIIFRQFFNTPRGSVSCELKFD